MRNAHNTPSDRHKQGQDQQMTEPMSHPPEAPESADGRRYVRRLRTLAERLAQQAALVRNGGYDTGAERRAGRLLDDAYAVRWALRQICAESEFLHRFFASLDQAGGPR
jgi:flagellar biosynthesis/type III secretory pathway ATPase